MIGLITAPRPARLAYASIAALYESYHELFICTGFSRTVGSECGMSIELIDRHFLHLVGLGRPGCKKGTMDMRDEKSRILSCRDGFLDYEHDAGRSTLLPATLDCLLSPHIVVLMKNPQSGTHSFFKHFDGGPYPVIQVLVGPSESGTLIPVTSFQTRLRQAKGRVRDNDIVWVHPELEVEEKTA